MPPTSSRRSWYSGGDDSAGQARPASPPGAAPDRGGNDQRRLISIKSRRSKKLRMHARISRAAPGCARPPPLRSLAAAKPFGAIRGTQRSYGPRARCVPDGRARHAAAVCSWGSADATGPTGNRHEIARNKARRSAKDPRPAPQRSAAAIQQEAPVAFHGDARRHRKRRAPVPLPATLINPVCEFASDPRRHQ